MINLISKVALASLLAAVSAAAWAATLTVEVVDQHGSALPDAVVTLTGSATAPTGPLKADMDQRDQEFSPRVLAVHTGTQVQFPNSDNIRHQVYSFSPARRFELRLYEGTPSRPLLFDKPGVVVLGCNIHDWMVGYIYVTDEPLFGVTDSKGVLSLDPVPPGRYQATLWHPRSEDMQPAAGGEFEVPPTGLAQRLTLTVQPDPEDKPGKPAPGGFGDAFHKAVHE